MSNPEKVFLGILAAGLFFLLLGIVLLFVLGARSPVPEAAHLFGVLFGFVGAIGWLVCLPNPRK